MTAKLAGFDCNEALSEPFADALSLGLERFGSKKPKYWLILNIGGSKL